MAGTFELQAVGHVVTEFVVSDGHRLANLAVVRPAMLLLPPFAPRSIALSRHCASTRSPEAVVLAHRARALGADARAVRGTSKALRWRTQLPADSGRPIGMHWFSIDEHRHVLELDCVPAIEVHLDADARGVFAVWVDSESGVPLWIAEVGEA